MFVNHIRKYYADFTFSKIYINGKFFCYCLEDVARPINVKVYSKTCIPEGVYDIAVTFSNRFQRDTIQLHNTQDMAVERNGIRFTGIRVHGGNDVDDTEGCPLTAYHGDEALGKVWGRADKDLLKKVKELQLKKWVISS